MQRTALHRLLSGTVAGLLLCVSSSVPAAPPRADESPQGQARQPPQPPREALQACQSLVKGAACEFSMPRGKISGRCDAPEGRPLACRPNDMPGQGGQGMPAPGAKGKP